MSLVGLRTLGQAPSPPGKLTPLPSAVCFRPAGAGRRGSGRGPQGYSEAEAHMRYQEQHSWDSNVRDRCLGEPVVKATRSAEQISERRTRHTDSMHLALESRGGTSCLGLRLCCAGASRSGQGGALASESACRLGTDPTSLVPLRDNLGSYHPLLLFHLPTPSCLRALGCLFRDSLSGLPEIPPP